MEDTPQKQDENRNPDGTFKDGISGNPGGRPKGSISIKAMLLKRLEEVPLGQTKAWSEQMVDVILEKAIVSKDPAVLKMIAEYVDGKPVQPIGTVDNQPLVVRLVQFDGNNNTPQPESKQG